MNINYPDKNTQMTQTRIPTPPSPKAVFQRAGRDGLPLGLALTGFTVVPNLSTDTSLAPLLLLCTAVLAGALLALPYIMLRNGYYADNYGSRFSDLWSQGIASFFLGGMIHALVVYALLRFAVPDFIAGRVDMAIAILSGTSDPQIESLVTAMENMKKAHMLPTPTQVSAEILTMDVFFGSCISFISTIAVRVRYSSPERRKRLASKMERTASPT